MDIERYVQLSEAIISAEDLSPAQKKNYYMMLEKLKRMEYILPNNYEDKSYHFKGKTLSEQERIIYELNRLLKYQKIDSTSIKKLAYQLSNKKSLENYNDIKKKITKLQLENGVTPCFYSIFESLIEEETKSSMEKRLYNEEKVITKNK